MLTPVEYEAGVGLSDSAVLVLPIAFVASELLVMRARAFGRHWRREVEWEEHDTAVSRPARPVTRVVPPAEVCRAPVVTQTGVIASSTAAPVHSQLSTVGSGQCGIWICSSCRSLPLPLPLLGCC